jgi:predicted AlkP superfamily phosphohydrolase/phosphomutase
MYEDKSSENRVLVIGLDCATPQLVFDKWLDELPHLRGLCERGAYGNLRSCDPPITVPAWSVMMSSRCPGSLGIYGFRNRSSRAYDQLKIVTSADVKVDRVWDILSQAGKKVIAIGVPLTYPVSKVNGIMVSDFLTPSLNCEFTHPPELKAEIHDVVGEYIFDVRDFRSDNKLKILEDIYEMTRKRFVLMRHFMVTKQWDFLMMVEMGTDRIHHAFWSYMDTEHRKYEAGHPYEQVIRDYYHFIDDEIGKTLALVDNNTTVMIVSDHGAKRMDGGICINDWLIQEGYMHLEQPTNGVTPFGKAKIDWSRTVAWGDGGYYARVFINLKGREPQGVVDPKDYEKIRAELAQKLAAIPDDRGQPIPTEVHRPEELYPKIENIAPDLLVYFGDLYWRSIGTVGNPGIHCFENDTGLDDANHAREGILIGVPSENLSFGVDAGTELTGVGLLDVAPTILEIMGVPIPKNMEGRPFCVAQGEIATEMV